jgi:flagellar basal body rod protein FlgG
MIYGLYLSAQGAQIQSLRQEVVANNLANSASTAFKRDLVRAQACLPYDAEHGRPTWLASHLDNMPGGVLPYQNATDFAQGQLNETRGPLDIALEGQGFLRVTDGKKHFLTRDGQLALNAQNEIVTQEHGYAVDGSLSQAGTPLGQFDLVEPKSYQELQKTGRNLYTYSGRLTPAKPEVQVKQGFLETSNVKPVLGMTELIETARVLEANVNLIRYQDESLARLLQSLPRK